MSHTVTVILGGVALLLVLYGLAYLRGTSMRRAFPAFCVIWAIAAAINLWVGVARAGYSFAEELPIFAVVFAVPAFLAWIVARRLA
ncbi:hypothetical protein [Celeribacter sp.]|uniref:hypothetical protein n=1 Tax=Celeribacter sp. TaxID=1890673 RepID=UPI003A932207